MRRSDWLTLAALLVGAAAGLGSWRWSGNGWAGLVAGVIVAAFVLKGLQQGAAARSIVDSRTVNDGR